LHCDCDPEEYITNSHHLYTPALMGEIHENLNSRLISYLSVCNKTFTEMCWPVLKSGNRVKPTNLMALKFPPVIGSEI